MNAATKAGAGAGLVALALVGALAWRASQNVVEVGYWFDLHPAELPRHVNEPLGGPFSSQELASIEQISRTELESAFDGLRLSFSDRRDTFWKIEVLNDLVVNTESPYAGWPSGVAESVLLGPLGGRATVSFFSIAQFAVTHAPPGASRQQIIDGIGRGIARAAAHELAHLVAVGDIHDPTDSSSYEFPHADRAVQYYGELHWGRAWPILTAKLGN